jgi:RNA polymerase sigma factor (sigma-70 family)
MEVSALKYPAVMGRHARSPLLRLQSDERLIAFVRRGNHAAFETLVSRYEVRLLAFCRHMLASREDAEDVLQEVFAAAFNAILADDRPINVRPWLYRIARNRSLNHLRRIQAVPSESMDLHLSDHGDSAADKVHNRVEFRLLVGDIQELPETQCTALLLREMDALSYEQIAEAMETTVPSVKSLLVRARVSLAEAAEARLLSCKEVRIELGEIAEGLRRRPSPLVRRHLKACERCSTFRAQLRHTNKALAALLPIGPLIFFKKIAIAHLGHSAGAGSGATAAGSGATATAAGAAAAGSGAAGTGVLAGSTAGGVISASIGAAATKAAAGLAAAAIVTAAGVEVDRAATHHAHRAAVPVAVVPSAREIVDPAPIPVKPVLKPKAAPKSKTASTVTKKQPAKTAPAPVAAKTAPAPVAATTAAAKTAAKTAAVTPPAATPKPGRMQTTTDTTILPTDASTSTPSTASSAITTITSTTSTLVTPQDSTETTPAPATPPPYDPTPATMSPSAGTPAPPPSTTPTPGAPAPTATTPAGSPGTSGQAAGAAAPTGDASTTPPAPLL